MSVRQQRNPARLSLLTCASAVHHEQERCVFQYEPSYDAWDACIRPGNTGVQTQLSACAILSVASFGDAGPERGLACTASVPSAAARLSIARLNGARAHREGACGGRRYEQVLQQQRAGDVSARLQCAHTHHAPLDTAV